MKQRFALSRYPPHHSPPLRLIPSSIRPLSIRPLSLIRVREPTSVTALTVSTLPVVTDSTAAAEVGVDTSSGDAAGIAAGGSGGSVTGGETAGHPAVALSLLPVEANSPRGASTESTSSSASLIPSPASSLLLVSSASASSLLAASSSLRTIPRDVSRLSASVARSISLQNELKKRLCVCVC